MFRGTEVNRQVLLPSSCNQHLNKETSTKSVFTGTFKNGTCQLAHGETEATTETRQVCACCACSATLGHCCFSLLSDISGRFSAPSHVIQEIRFCCMQMQCKLTVVLVIACLFMILEFAGGLIANRCLHSSPDFHLLHSCAEFFAHQDGV